MANKSPDMLLLEESFKDIKSKHNTHGALQRVQRVLKRNFDLDFNISISENDTGKFFGMSIYPNQNQIDKMIDSIFNKKSGSAVIVDMWQKTEVWNLEIDSILLYDGRLNANPAEIVAVLLHEVGHIVYSNSIPQRIHKILRYKMMTASMSLKKLIQWSKAQKLIQLVFIEACSSKDYHQVKEDTEVIADKFVIKMGYGENLNEFITKLIATQGNHLVNRGDGALDRDVSAAVNWTFINIGELEFRKTSIRTALQAELLKSPSKFVKEVVYDIKNTFFGSGDESYADAITEQYIFREFNDVVKEGMLGLFDKHGKVKKVNQLDIDIIEVEIGKIDNDDDKIYVLDLIYDKLNIVNAALDFIKSGEKEKVNSSKDTLISYKSQLEKLRQTVLDTSVKPKQYGVFMKAPKGYEG